MTEYSGDQSTGGVLGAMRRSLGGFLRRGYGEDLAPGQRNPSPVAPLTREGKKPLQEVQDMSRKPSA